jgi:hypothetical protein
MQSQNNNQRLLDYFPYGAKPLFIGSIVDTSHSFKTRILVNSFEHLFGYIDCFSNSFKVLSYSLKNAELDIRKNLIFVTKSK